MGPLEKSKVPSLVRKLITNARKWDEKNREQMKMDLAMRVGGDGQWDQAELRKRREQNRPVVAINKVSMPVDHIENEIRQNPPGPICHPVGNGADNDTADIIEGLIRETEYRSRADIAYETAGGMVAAGGFACFELSTDYVDPLKNDDQQLWINVIEDPTTVIFDPNARKFDRSDAMWAARIKALGREQYVARFGERRGVVQGFGWKDALSQAMTGDRPTIIEWTGNGKGPYWVIEFYWVDIERKTMRMYTDNIARADDDDIPSGVKPKKDYEPWIAPVKTVWLYVCDAIEVLEEPVKWLGTRPPLFPVVGQEIWVEGENNRLSLIRQARGAQKGLNYAASEMLYLAGTMTKSPWTGPAGVFGNGDKWDTANQEPWAYIEWYPQFYPDSNGQMHMGPGPQRVERIAEVDASLKMCAFFADSIQSVTGMLDPSRQLAAQDNSGVKVASLQQQGKLGSLQYQDNVMRTIGSIYEEMLYIFPQILDTARAETIIRADGKTELALINQEFGQAHPETGKRSYHDMKNSLGKYGVRVSAGPSYMTRRDQAIGNLNDFFKIAPGALQSPKMMAQFLRLIGEGNPAVSQMAEILDPDLGSNVSNESLQQQLKQAQQQGQAMQQVIQALSEKLKAGLPKIEADKWKAALDALTKIEVAKITASKDMDTAAADREANALQQILQMSHDMASQAVDQQHQQEMQQMQAAQQQQAAQQAAPQQEQQ